MILNLNCGFYMHIWYIIGYCFFLCSVLLKLPFDFQEDSAIKTKTRIKVIDYIALNKGSFTNYIYNNGLGGGYEISTLIDKI